MAITVEFLKSLGLESDVADKIFAERGGEIKSDKEKLAAVKAELKAKSEAFDALTSELDALKASNASGEDWRKKFEGLQAENEEKARQAAAEKAAAEKEARLHESFDNALSELGKKKEDWNGRFTEYGYYNAFAKALEQPENASKSHKDILSDLVKDDPDAFKGVKIVLAGGTKQSQRPSDVTIDEFKKMSYRERLELFDKNPELYENLKKKE